MKNICLIVVLVPFLYLTSACGDGEPETENIDPTIRIRFINEDSLSTLNSRISDIDSEIEAIDDSLQHIDSLLVLDTLDMLPTDFSEEIELLNEQRDELEEELAGFNTTIETIESGLVRVASISSSSGVQPKLPGIDSMEVFELPLNPASDVSQLDISLAGKVYDVEVVYDRNTVVEQRTVLVQALNPKVSSSTFNSVSIIYTDSLSNNSKDAIITANF